MNFICNSSIKAELGRISGKCFGIAHVPLHASRCFWRVESKYLSGKSLSNRYSRGSLEIGK